MRHTSSLPTQTCTWGGSNPFSLVLTTKRNRPSIATVGIRVTEQGITLCISIVALKSSAAKVSYSDTINQTRNSGDPLPTSSKTCSQSASTRRCVLRLLASALLATDTRAHTWSFPLVFRWPPVLA